MKYKLINKNSCTKNGIRKEGESCNLNNNCAYPNCCEEHLCDKVTIDEFDYYIGDVVTDINTSNVWHTNSGPKFHPFLKFIGNTRYAIEEFEKGNFRKVIATNNPNIDISQVVDKVEQLAHKYFAGERFNWEQENPNGLKPPQSLIEHYNKTFTPLFKAGYKKSQETHPFSLDDVKKIINLAREQYWDIDNRGFSSNTEGDWSFKYSTEDEIIQKYQETKLLTIFYE